MTAKRAALGLTVLAFVVASSYGEAVVKEEMRAHAPRHELHFSDYLHEPRYVALKLLWATGFLAFGLWCKGAKPRTHQ